MYLSVFLSVINASRLFSNYNILHYIFTVHEDNSLPVRETK